MVSNQGIENSAISLDEDELRRLLEQPMAEDMVEGSALEDGGEAIDLELSHLADAGIAGSDGDRRSAATGLDGTGLAALGAPAALGQESIDQLLAQARGEATIAASPPAATPSQPAPAPSRPAPPPPKTPARPAAAPPKAPVTVQPVQFAPLGGAAGRRDQRPLSDLGILLDVPLRITAELGRAEMSVREVLSLGPGSVIELDRTAGEVLDVLVNGTLVAQGEVVVVDEQFGIRLTHVLSPNKDMLEGMGGE